jgi:hypothetical protein
MDHPARMRRLQASQALSDDFYRLFDGKTPLTT